MMKKKSLLVINLLKSPKMPNQCKFLSKAKEISRKLVHFVIEKYGKTETETEKYDIFSRVVKKLVILFHQHQHGKLTCC